jgi:hypothetical protein
MTNPAIPGANATTNSPSRMSPPKKTTACHRRCSQLPSRSRSSGATPPAGRSVRAVIDLEPSLPARAHERVRFCDGAAPMHVVAAWSPHSSAKRARESRSARRVAASIGRRPEVTEVPPHARRKSAAQVISAPPHANQQTGSPRSIQVRAQEGTSAPTAAGTPRLSPLLSSPLRSSPLRSSPLRARKASSGATGRSRRSFSDCRRMATPAGFEPASPA